MASQSLISTVNGYENYIKDKGIDEQVINAYVDACSVAINGEKDIEYGLQLTKRAKELIEDFCTAKQVVRFGIWIITISSMRLHHMT